jgi:ferredoxin
MRVTVDADVCTGHGRCYALAPEVFGPDDFGHCELLVADGEVPDGLQAQARTGRDNCPELAITISE